MPMVCFLLRSGYCVPKVSRASGSFGRSIPMTVASLPYQFRNMLHGMTSLCSKTCISIAFIQCSISYSACHLDQMPLVSRKWAALGFEKHYTYKLCHFFVIARNPVSNRNYDPPYEIDNLLRDLCNLLCKYTASVCVRPVIC